MAFQVCAGALLSCSFGVAPGPLVVLPEKRTLTGTPAATILDAKPMLNVPSFAMCSSPANPMVAAATAAVLGVLTPMPCLPVLPAPWVVGAPTTLIGNLPALTSDAKLTCAWGGVIQILMAGQVSVQHG